MSDFNNIPTGLKITSQIPLDIKGYALNEATLAYLGVDDNLAFTYYDGLKVICIEEKTTYEWREVQSGEENTGLIPIDFTYPLNLSSVYGINYSGKKFNFFKVNNNFSISNIGTGSKIYKNFVIENGTLNFNLKTLISQNDSVKIEENSNEINLEVNNVYLQEGNNITITGEGTELNPYIISTTGGSGGGFTLIENGISTEVQGNGSELDPYKVNVVNLQKEISTNYTLQASDHLHTIFLSPNADMTITIPETGLPNNFVVGFYHVSTPSEYVIIFVVENETTQTMRVPSGFSQQINTSGNLSCMIERRLSTQEYMLNGDLQIIIE